MFPTNPENSAILVEWMTCLIWSPVGPTSRGNTWLSVTQQMIWSVVCLVWYNLVNSGVCSKTATPMVPPSWRVQAVSFVSIVIQIPNDYIPWFFFFFLKLRSLFLFVCWVSEGGGASLKNTAATYYHLITFLWQKKQLPTCAADADQLYLVSFQAIWQMQVLISCRTIIIVPLCLLVRC